MRPFDFAPLYRSTVGFDRLVQLLDSVAGNEADVPAYPPYNIERLGENQYRITMAVAGFGQDDIKIEVKELALTIKGEKKPEDKDRQFLHRGIATRAFERRVQLADHVEVSGADLKDGLAACRSRSERARAAEAARDCHWQRGHAEADRSACLKRRLKVVREP